MSQKQSLVLVCPLDWGLGHASRMIAVIDHFISLGSQVILGGSGKSGELLKTTFPQLPFIQIPSPVIRYSRKGQWLIPALMLQLPSLIFSVVREHLLIKKIVLARGINIIVSDNRYGLFCRHAHSIFVTHQISPVLPSLLRWAEYPLYLIIRTVILQFDECWIPDYADPHQNLSGILSHRYKLPENARFVGILSRFNLKSWRKQEPFAEKYALVVVISGPEPQSGIFNALLLRQILTLSHKTLIISGFMHSPLPIAENGHVLLTQIPHLEPDQFGQVLLHADHIVCRSGYSGIMDLVALGLTALLVPTPGQPEQQYLAEYLSGKGWFSWIRQHTLDLSGLMKAAHSISPLPAIRPDQNERLPVVLGSKDKHR